MATPTDGFVRLPNWLIDDSDLSLHELAVYVVLLRFRNPKTGTCHPGMTTIADRARMSRDTVKRTIPTLEAKGLIRVNRKKVDGRNLVNEYTVAVATETPAHIWETTKRGQRIPKRTPRRSEHPPAEEAPEGRRSEHLPRRSEHPPLGAPSTSKKTKEKKIHGEALRRNLPIAPEQPFSFDEINHVTDKQLDYLNDLYIFLTEREPEQRTRTKWEALSSNEASDLIRVYWKQMDRGRGGMWESSVDSPDHPLYPLLSDNGKAWIYNGCVPDGWIGAVA